jgi:hypothetical protein
VDTLRREGKMEFIADFGFDVKKGRAQDFQRWLSENESKLAAACPSGVEYVGTYAVMYSSEKHAGSYRQFFRMESYGSQDTMAAAMKEGGAFAKLIEETSEFVDQDREADWSNGLYKSVTDISLWGEA